MKVKLDLKTLEHIKFVFDIHSDSSTQTNGYRSLCDIIDEVKANPQKNTIVTVGYLGVKKAYLNVSKDEAIKRYSAGDSEEDWENFTDVIEFEDEFGCYEIYEDED